MNELKQNIIDVVQEGLLKLGYRREPIRLYYPLDTLNAFWGTTQNASQMLETLKRFADAEQNTFGSITISQFKNRFCLTIPPEGVEAINAHTDRNGFLAQFIAAIARHDTSIEDLLSIFHRFSDSVVVKPLHNGEFDYLVYFQDGKPDAFYYCITQEPCHMTYHRFTKQDYEAFGF